VDSFALEFLEWAIDLEEKYGVSLEGRYLAANVGELCDSVSAAINAARGGEGVGVDAEVELALFKLLSANPGGISRSSTFYGSGMEAVYRDGSFHL
jgi:hypothetical protein